MHSFQCYIMYFKIQINFQFTFHWDEGLGWGVRKKERKKTEKKGEKKKTVNLQQWKTHRAARWTCDNQMLRRTTTDLCTKVIHTFRKNMRKTESMCGENERFA